MHSKRDAFKASAMDQAAVIVFHIMKVIKIVKRLSVVEYRS